MELKITRSRPKTNSEYCEYFESLCGRSQEFATDCCVSRRKVPAKVVANGTAECPRRSAAFEEESRGLDSSWTPNHLFRRISYL
jgi:hypothetical protein